MDRKQFSILRRLAVPHSLLCPLTWPDVSCMDTALVYSPPNLFKVVACYEGKKKKADAMKKGLYF